MHHLVLSEEDLGTSGLGEKGTWYQWVRCAVSLLYFTRSVPMYRFGNLWLRLFAGSVTMFQSSLGKDINFVVVTT